MLVLTQHKALEIKACKAISPPITWILHKQLDLSLDHVTVLPGSRESDADEAEG